MPRIKMGIEVQPRRADATLVDRLVDELKAGRESGQPTIYEQTFGTGKIRILVIWDAWKDLSLEERTNIILSAIEKAEGKKQRAKVALASGLTVPESIAAGMVPYQVSAARRKSDTVTEKQCREAMLKEGASTLFGPDVLQLRFPDEHSAEACRARLIKRLPNSDEIWIVTREITANDLGAIAVADGL
jgi:hypothetical protein